MYPPDTEWSILSVINEFKFRVNDAVNDRTVISRTIITVVMWLVMGAISFFALASSVFIEDWAVVVLTLVPLVMAVIGTAFVWDVGGSADDEAQHSAQSEKAKRQAGDDRVRMLLELMDDDEREALKQQLRAQMLRGDSGSRLGQDGELPVNFADLLDDDEDKKRVGR